MIPAFDPGLDRGKLVHALVLVDSAAAPMCGGSPDGTNPTGQLFHLSTDWRRIRCPGCRAAGERTAPAQYQEYFLGGPHHGQALIGEPANGWNVKLLHRQEQAAFDYDPKAPHWPWHEPFTEHTYVRETVGVLGHGLVVWVERDQKKDKSTLHSLGEILLAPHRRPRPNLRGPDRV